ncbi:hypothetical protein PINS_up009721 [Pythium insidiosum]|nr:hypothetical protein PINS_up009721 [Pythium insidiosum]
MPCEAVCPPAIEVPIYVSIPEPAQPSSPLFAPTAPDFELLVLEESTPAALDVNGERAKQLAFGKTSSKSPPGKGSRSAKSDAVSSASPVSAGEASARGVDFLALAFNAKSSLSADCARPRETETETETESLTEFSF